MLSKSSLVGMGPPPFPSLARPYLHHAAKVVWPGRAFLRRFIDLLCCFRNKDHPFRINQEFRPDLQRWQQFLASWHGVGFWL